MINSNMWPASTEVRATYLCAMYMYMYIYIYMYVYVYIYIYIYIENTIHSLISPRGVLAEVPEARQRSELHNYVHMATGRRLFLSGIPMFQYCALLSCPSLCAPDAGARRHVRGAGQVVGQAWAQPRGAVRRGRRRRYSIL